MTVSADTVAERSWPVVFQSLLQAPSSLPNKTLDCRPDGEQSPVAAFGAVDFDPGRHLVDGSR